MIQKPNPTNVRFLVPEVLAQVDALVEPTVEDIGANNVVGDIIADGGVIAGAWDGRPDFRPKIGTDLLTGADSDFSEDTENWTLGAGVSIVGGKLVFSGSGNDASITLPLSTGTYEVVYTVSGRTASSMTAKVGGTSGTARSTNATFTEDIIGGGTTVFTFDSAAAFDGSIDDVTIRHKSAWRIDAALERRARADLDFALIDRANFHEAYASAIQSVVNWFAAGTDALPASPLGVTRFVSGLLGEPGPYASYDGEAAYTSVADDPNLNFGAYSDFSISWRGGTASTTAQRLVEKGSTTGTDKRYLLTMLADGTVRAQVDDGATNVSASGTVAINDGVEHIVVATYDRDGLMLLYVDGVLDASSSITAVGNIDDTAEPLTFGIKSQDESSNPFDGDKSEIMIHNRALAPKEIEQMALGVPVPEPFIIGDNSSMNSIGDYGSGGSATVTGGYDSGDSGHEATLRVEAGDSFRERAILTNLSFISGHRYRLELDYKYIDIAGMSSSEIIASISDGSSVAAFAAVVPAAGAWTSFDSTITFDGSFTPDRIRLNANAATGGNASNEVLFDNVYLTDLDTKVTFPLVVDQGGSQTGMFQNPDMGSSTGWTLDTEWTIGAGVASFDYTGTGYIGQAVAFAAGITYRATFTTSNLGASVARIALFGNSGAVQVRDYADYAAGTFSIVFTPSVAFTNLWLYSAIGAGGGTFDLDNFDVVRLGAVAVYQPDGLTATDWYDGSINANHGVHNGVDVWNIPDEQHPGFAYWGLTPFNLRYLFTQINPNALTALALFKLGWLVWGKSYSFDYDKDGGHSIGINWPGMNSVTTEGGAVYVEKKFGIRPSWDVTLIAYDDDGFDDIQDFIDRVDGSLNPFYYVSDYAATEPIFNRVRLTGGVVPVTYRNGEHSWQGVRFTMVSEGI